MLFRTVSELMSLIPYVFGVVIRAEFYRFALQHCGRNVVIEFGTVFIYPEISIGDNVTIGRYSLIHHCDIGNYVLVGEGSSLLSGSRQHNYDRLDVPMALRGKKKRIALEDDCWIGANAVVMEEVGRGAIVGAGSVVTKQVPPYTIVVGNPAKPVRTRREPAASEVAFIDSSYLKEAGASR
jgi:acetyltransferase-like isoleucine patch superfamily enzyme